MKSVIVKLRVEECKNKKKYTFSPFIITGDKSVKKVKIKKNTPLFLRLISGVRV